MSNNKVQFGISNVLLLMFYSGLKIPSFYLLKSWVHVLTLPSVALFQPGYQNIKFDKDMIINSIGKK